MTKKERCKIVRAQLAVIHKADEEIAERTKLRRGALSKLRAIAAMVFSEESEPINGITAEPREIVVSHRICAMSPIMVCAYAYGVMSLPGQRGAATGDDACLFCGATYALGGVLERSGPNRRPWSSI